MRHSQTPRTIIAAIAGGVAFVVFVLLMSLVGIRIAPALLLAILVAVAVVAILLARVRRSDAGPEASIASSGVPSAAGTASGAVYSDKGAGRRGDLVEPAGGEQPGDESQVDAQPDRADASDPLADDATVPSGDAPTPGEARGTSEVEALPDPAGSGAFGEADAGDLSTAEGGALQDEEPATRSAPSAASTEGAAVAGSLADASPSEEDPAHGMIGTEPERLSAPREGAADDLKRIKGIGPKLEEALNSLGVYHLDQIGGWTEQEAAWVDEHIEGFKGRVMRDEWIAQARTLVESPEADDRS